MTILDSKTDSDNETTRPSYYGGPNAPFEPVKVIDDIGLGAGFYFGSALKYIQRSPHKGTRLKDLQKAEWYLSNGVDLGYRTPVPGNINPKDIVTAWQLDEGLSDVATKILTGKTQAASEAMKEYLLALAPQPETAPMPFSKG